MKSKKCKISLIICSVLVALFSCFAVFNINSVEGSVYASSEGSTTAYYTYNSSNYQLAYSLCSSQDLTTISSGFDYARFGFSFSNDPVKSGSTSLVYFDLIVNYYSGGFVSSSDSAVINYNVSTPIWLDVNGQYLPTEIYCDEGFDFYPTRLIVGSSFNSSLNLGYNKFIYSDADGDEFRIYAGYFYADSIYYYGLTLEDRTYYLTADYTEDYESGYNSGYNNGYNVGYAEGDSHGASDGYNNGYNVGYNNGYNAGLDEQDVYTFNNLISAVIDAPVSYFTSLFNFELLGINLTDFFLGLFTLCVIVTIIKMCLGR